MIVEFEEGAGSSDHVVGGEGEIVETDVDAESFAGVDRGLVGGAVG